MKELCKENIWREWSNAKKSDLIHNFTMKNYDRAQSQQDYGIGIACTPVEVRLLEKICEYPGMTSTELAKRISRSKSAVSQIIKKLEQKYLIYRIPQQDHIKKLSIYPTEVGKKQAEVHVMYDERSAGEFFRKLSESFDDEAMNHFFCVLYKFMQIMYPDYKDYQ